jgi:hypothetical protein
MTINETFNYWQCYHDLEYQSQVADAYWDDGSGWRQGGSVYITLLDEVSGGTARALQGKLYRIRMHKKILSLLEMTEDFYAGPDPATEAAADTGTGPQAIDGSLTADATLTKYTHFIIRHPSPGQ